MEYKTRFQRAIYPAADLFGGLYTLAGSGLEAGLANKALGNGFLKEAAIGTGLSITLLCLGLYFTQRGVVEADNIMRE